MTGINTSDFSNAGNAIGGLLNPIIGGTTETTTTPSASSSTATVLVIIVIVAIVAIGGFLIFSKNKNLKTA